jgi:type II secretory pathway predicted ATPase ExeA
MRAEVMQHFGIRVPFNQAGYYETAHHKELMKDIRGAINEGRLIAVCGVIGSGKTVLLRRLQEILDEERQDHGLTIALRRETQHQARRLHRGALL